MGLAGGSRRGPKTTGIGGPCAGPRLPGIPRGRAERRSLARSCSPPHPRSPYVYGGVLFEAPCALFEPSYSGSVGTHRGDARRSPLTVGSGAGVRRKVDFAAPIPENSRSRADSLAVDSASPELEALAVVDFPRSCFEASALCPRPTPPRGPRMPASWITDRPTPSRRAPRPAERPRLELPLHQPSFERARPQHDAERDPSEGEGKTERGTAVVDFYI